MYKFANNELQGMVEIKLVRQAATRLSCTCYHHLTNKYGLDPVVIGKLLENFKQGSNTIQPKCFKDAPKEAER